MRVREAMSESVLTVGPSLTLRAAAEKMVERKVGSAVVVSPEMQGPGIVSERDVLIAVAQGADPETALVADHMTDRLVFAARRFRSRLATRPRRWRGTLTNAYKRQRISPARRPPTFKAARG